jgi:hypothetical protein
MPEWLEEILAKPTTSVPLAGKALGLSRNASYEAARRGEISVLEFGKLRRVPTAWLRKQLQLANANSEAA